DVVLLSPRSTESASILSYWMESSVVKRALDLSTQGTTFKRINVAAIKKLPWVQIPKHQRQTVLDHLDEVTGKIDTMLAKVAQLKDLLTERRAALITDVVTGRKDVA